MAHVIWLTTTPRHNSDVNAILDGRVVTAQPTVVVMVTAHALTKQVFVMNAKV